MSYNVTAWRALVAIPVLVLGLLGMGCGKSGSPTK
jgi:hypothetical protein